MIAEIVNFTTSELLAELKRRATLGERSKVIDVVLAVSQVTGVPGEIILSKRRTEEASFARFISIYQARKLNPYWTLEKTAKQFGRKDHATIIHALKAYKNQYINNPHFRKHADQCNNLLKK
jgi:chromosomal replication initiation ATPase DnaA